LLHYSDIPHFFTKTTPQFFVKGYGNPVHWFTGVPKPDAFTEMRQYRIYPGKMDSW
jgi:hypothetical protein